MALGISPFLDAIGSKDFAIKKTETILPIAQKTVHVSALKVGDDLALRSSLTSPVGYDRDIVKLIHSHSNIVEEDRDIVLDYNKFINEISNIDKLSLIWALYKSTYEYIIRERRTTCPNTNCKQEFKTDIMLDDLIHEDTYTLWEEVNPADNTIIPFFNYRFPINIEDGDKVYSFNARIPSIRDNNVLMGMIPTDVLQHNMETIGTTYTRVQQISLLIDAMGVSSKTNKIAPAETRIINEILMALNNHVPYPIADEFFTAYGKKFDKYLPKYYKNEKCPICNHEFKINVEIEVEFFKRILYGTPKVESTESTESA